jgi:cyclopropane-fatty-acyl-phospholipid synthase
MKSDPFGEKGDFITAPNISILFSEMIAIWTVSFWENLNCPKQFNLVELGAGNGEMMKILIKTFNKFPKFQNACNVKILEKSELLKKMQKQKIKNKKVRWLDNLNDLNNLPCIFIANEFFDALPIKQIHKKKKLFFEKYVSLSNNNKKIKFLYKKANNTLIKRLRNLNLISSGKIIEYPIEALKFLEFIAQKINKFDGALLAFDYGNTKTKSQSTLQSVKKHKYINLFLNPGYSDITSHINFNLFNQILKKNNLEVKKITNQNEFLRKIGIL